MIILASTSVTRQAMLSNAGVHFTPIAPGVDERRLAAEHPDWTPEETARNLAASKALEVSARYPSDVVIGADQVLSLEGKLFSKPQNILDCRRQLQELRGRRHDLISSAACARNGAMLWSAAQTASLSMRQFTGTFLDSYLAENGARCQASVGGYQIEGPGLQLFDGIIGDYFTILGLPLLPLLNYLRSAGHLAS